MEAPSRDPARGRALRARAPRAAGHPRLHPREHRHPPARRRRRGPRRGHHLVHGAPRPGAGRRPGVAARGELDAGVVLRRPRDAGATPPLGVRERRARPRAPPGRYESRRRGRARGAADLVRDLARPRRHAERAHSPALAGARAEPPLQARPGRGLERRADRRARGHRRRRDGRLQGVLQRRRRAPARPCPVSARRRGLPRRLSRGPRALARDRRGARTFPRPRHLGRAHPLGRRRRGAGLAPARAQLEALALRPPGGRARFLRLLRGPRDRALRRRHVRARARPRPDPVPRFAVPPGRPERCRAARVQRSRAAARPAAQPAPAEPGKRRVSVARGQRYSLTDQSINEVDMATAEAIGSGVSFALTDEQKALRELAHEFAEKEIRPRSAEYDEHQTHPADVIAKAHEVGLMNPHLPEDLGGAGLGAIEGALIGEELCWGCAGIGTSIIANILGALPVLVAGNDEQRRAWLSPLLEEPLLCSFGLTEPNAGSDVSGIQTTAVRHGDDYVINGSKMFITNAGHASWLTVFASTDKEAGHRGLTAFLVATDTEGVTVERHLDKLGQRATDTSALALQDVKVPAANRLGEEGQDFKIAMQTLDATRPGTAAGAVGVARAAFEHAVEYARERVQFGQPIAMNQGVNFLVADMATEIEASRLLVWQAAWLLDQGRRATLQSSYAKRFAADTAMKVTTDAVQVFGGYGYIKEYPVEKLMRDAKLFQIYEGTSQIQRLVIARE